MQPQRKNIIIATLLIIAAFAAGRFFDNSSAESWKDKFSFLFKPELQTQSPVQSAPSYESKVDYEQAIISAVKKAAPAVVSITISKNVPVLQNCPYSNLPPQFRQFFGGDLPQCESGKTQLQEVGGGSGVIISADGLILTNKHVVADKEAAYTVFMSDGKKYEAKILAHDPVQDLAIIKIEAKNLPTVELGNSSSIQPGQTVIAIGNALGEFSNTVSVGIVSGLSRTITASGVDYEAETLEGVIQTDAAINSGNSGGPLLNLQGQVIGINSAVASGAQNIGFAIPINRAQRDVSAAKSGKPIEVPFLGVRYMTITAEFAEKEKLPVEQGVIVRGSTDGPAVAPNSPAAKAGIQAEDIIVDIDGQKLSEDRSLGSEIANHAVGDTVTLKINRDGKEIALKAILDKRPDNL